MAEPTTNGANSNETVYQSDPIVAALYNIAGYQHNISAALLHMAGVAVAYVQDDQVKLRAPTEEDGPQPRRMPGAVSTRWGDGGPIAWVFTPPVPYNDMEMVCVPDNSIDPAMRCTVRKKMVGGEVAQYDVSFTKKEPLK